MGLRRRKRISTALPAQDASLRKVRGVVARWIGLLAIGGVLLAAAYANDTKFLMPGPLSATHGLLKDCRMCHQDLPQGRLGWLHQVFANSNPKNDSGSCLSCHKIPENSFTPHNITRAKLKSNTKRLKQKTVSRGAPVKVRFSSAIVPAAMKSNGPIYCATCHREHKGINDDLKHVSDGQCQSCHALQFKSFNKGHPEFENYPYKRRTRILFDHAAHFAKHFPEFLKDGSDKQAIPNVCTDCHSNTAATQLMGVKPFKKVCSSCHIEQITGTSRASGPKGIAVLAIPGIDVETLKENGISIGAWPKESEADIGPFVTMLLSLDADRRSLVKQVSTLDLLDLSSATADQMAAVERFVWELKALLHQLSTSDTSLLANRIQAVTGARVDRNLAIKLVAAIPRDVLIGAQRQWLPGLEKEIKSRPVSAAPLWKTSVTLGPEPKAIDQTAPNTDAAKPGNANGPAKTPDRQRSGFRPDLRSNLLPTGHGLTIGTLTKDGSPVRLVQSQQPAGTLQPGWFVNPKGDLVKGDSADKSDQESDDDTSDQQDDQSSADDDTTAPDDDDGEDSTQASKADAGRQQPDDGVDGEAWASLGGWYRKDFTVYYKPTGHTDAFLQAWLNFSGKLLDGKQDNIALPVFESLTHKDAQGQCTKCHSVNIGKNRTRTIDWGTSTVADKAGRLTTFLHEPHFGLLDERGCLTCHKINEKSKYQASYKQPDPKVFSSNFMPMNVSQCASCHNRKAARQDCVICHRYHVNEATSPIATTKVPKATNETAKTPNVQ